MVTVYAKDISSGLYTYTLIVDGQKNRYEENG